MPSPLAVHVCGPFAFKAGNGPTAAQHGDPVGVHVEVLKHTDTVLVRSLLLGCPESLQTPGGNDGGEVHERSSSPFLWNPANTRKNLLNGVATALLNRKLTMIPARAIQCCPSVTAMTLNMASVTSGTATKNIVRLSMPGSKRGRCRVRLVHSQEARRASIQGIPIHMATSNGPKRSSTPAPDFNTSRSNHSQAIPMFTAAAVTKKGCLSAIR